MTDPIIKESGIPIGPRTESTKSFAVTLVANTNNPQDLSAVLPDVLTGGAMGFVSTAATQIAFGDSAVTIAANHPTIPANQLIYMVPSGQFVAFKSTGTPTVNIWYAGRIGP